LNTLVLHIAWFVKIDIPIIRLRMCLYSTVSPLAHSFEIQFRLWSRLGAPAVNTVGSTITGHDEVRRWKEVGSC
jgi:hypothetical protein